ncbi:hypothetical protein TNCV_2310661 [Trichonephila clavipes]|nr:hypothetical protein TNCV_2310661 [Trichonephila clavipes]
MISRSSLRWLGHLYRYADAFPTNKVIFVKIEGSRRRGQSPTRWLDEVEKDLKLMGINQWKAIVTDRVNWRRGGRGNPVVKVMDSWLACYEFEPSATKDPPRRCTMHNKSVESSDVLPLVWSGS